MWEEAGVPGENPRVQAGDRRTLSLTTTVDHGVRTRVIAVRSECNEHYATCTPYIVRYDTLVYCIVVLNKSRLYFDI